MEFVIKNEKPLDKLLDGPGFANIFRTIGVIGDSLSSGEMECKTDEGVSGGIDMFDYSWGQFMARTLGSQVYNFSKGGMTAEEFCESFGEKCGAFGKDARLCQCYIIALGLNDFNRSLADCKTPLPMGDVTDICSNSGFYNNKTIIGYYGRIIQKIKILQPDAKIFLMTMPRETGEDKIFNAFTEQLYKISDKFKNTYILDFRKYAPLYDDDFKKKFFLGSHLNAAGYSLTAKMVISYIDYIIRHNFDDFSRAAFIGTQYH